MLKRVLLSLLPTLFAGHALANTVEFCPNPSEIQNTNGVLTTKTENGKGQWLGILQNPAASVTSFDHAIFYSSNDMVDGVGRLRACTYNTSDKKSVDMRYRPDVTPDVAIRLAYTPAWSKEEGPFGLVYFECRIQDLQGCAFREAE